jgi:hypothetical protein
MASQPIGTCRHAYDVGNTAHTELDYAIDSMVDQMNNWPQGTNYYYYKISSSTQPTPQPHECAGEVDYIKKCLQQLYDAGEVVDGDAWIIIDGWENYGYGYGGVPYDVPGTNITLWGARVLYTPSNFPADPVEVTHNIAIQEIGHCFGADHGDGTYRYTITSGGSKSGYDVTPMATAYTETDNVIFGSDTCWSGGETAPPSFCGGLDNYQLYNWCHDTSFLCSDPCRHDIQMTYCTKAQIDSAAPL